MSETELPDEFEHEVDLEHELPDQEQEQQPAEPLEEPRLEPIPAPQFNFNDRLYALGFSTSGKSELLNVIFSGVACQKILIDNKPEFTIPGIEPVHDVGEIDWREPVIHYQPAPGSDCTQYEELFAIAFTRRGLLICVHEFGALVDYNANRAGRYLISYLSQGSRLGLGLLAGTTRPVMVPTAGVTEANHVIVFVPSLANRDDLAYAASALSPVNGQPVSPQELMRELAQLQQEQGRYSCLWKDRYTGNLVAMPPLPEDLRNLSIVERLEDA